MSQQRIPVTVEPGLFSSERAASFDVGETRYHLLVDEEELSDGLLSVTVLGTVEDKALIELPRPTFTTGGRRVWVPTSLLVGD